MTGGRVFHLNNSTCTAAGRRDGVGRTGSRNVTSLAPLRIVYDGECPFCKAYIKFVRLRESAGGVELIDARGDNLILQTIRARGLDLDEGMVVEMDGRFYHGDAAMSVLAGMTTRSGWFNRLVRIGFSRPAVSRILYPSLVLGRRLVLILLGRRLIAADR